MHPAQRSDQRHPPAKPWIRKILLASLVVDAAAILIIAKFLSSGGPSSASADPVISPPPALPMSLGAMTSGEWTVHLIPTADGFLYDVYNARSELVAEEITADEVRSLFGVEIRGLDASGPDHDTKPALLGPDEIH